MTRNFVNTRRIVLKTIESKIDKPLSELMDLLKDSPNLNSLVPPLKECGKKYYFDHTFRLAQGESHV